jgi:hypothetical protein
MWATNWIWSVIREPWPAWTICFAEELLDVLRLGNLKEMIRVSNGQRFDHSKVDSIILRRR